MSAYVRVAKEEGVEPVELALENDSTLLLVTLTSQVSNASGLKYRCGSGTWRGVRLTGDKFYPPDDGWDDKVFVVVSSKGEKRRVDDDDDGPRKKGNRSSDLIVLGLAWKTTEEQVRSYFETFGHVSMITVKTDQDGRSKGFGFVRFDDPVIQTKIISQRHFIDGRWCDVKIPNRQPSDAPQNCKIFVGQLTADISAVDLREYFSKFGEVTDIFIPQPFRMFAFVTFTSAEHATTVCNARNHSINGIPINVSVAMPLTKQYRTSKTTTNSALQLPNDQNYQIPLSYGVYTPDQLFNAEAWNSLAASTSYSWLNFPNYFGY